jgi:DNA-binding HxlR family transcriptional regulator
MELTGQQMDEALTQVNPALDQKVEAALKTAGSLELTVLLAALPGVNELALRQSLERLMSQGIIRPVRRKTTPQRFHS